MIKLGWLDRVPLPVRDLVVMAAVGLLTWLAQSGVPAASPWLEAHQPLGPLVAIALAQLVVWLLPVVRTYGLKWERDKRDGRHEAGSATLTLTLVAALCCLALIGAVLLAVRLGNGGTPPRPPAGVTSAPAAATDDGTIELVGLTSSSTRHTFRYPQHDERHRPPLSPAAPTGEHPRTNSAWQCSGVLMVFYDLEQLDPTGTEWLPAQNQGGTSLQLHEVSGRSGPGGQWQTIDPAVITVLSGWMRWAGYGAALQNGQHYDKARITLHGVAASPKLVTEGCPPQ